MAFAITACTTGSGDGDGSRGANGSCKSGRNAPFAAPDGTAFALPAGVVLDGEISGDVDAADCFRRPVVEYGGDLLPACARFMNTTDADITVRIPAGLTFLAANPATQNGIVLQDHDIVVPARSSVMFRFQLFCLNRYCVYGSKADRFTFGKVTTHPGLLEIIDIARQKRLEPGVSAYVFGQLVWDVTDGEGITDEHRALLSDVPNT
jgi:hypothetical protein